MANTTEYISQHAIKKKPVPDAALFAGDPKHEGMLVGQVTRIRSALGGCRLASCRDNRRMEYQLDS